MEKIVSSPQNANKPNRKSNNAIKSGKKSINTSTTRQRGNKVDIHEISYFGGAILARGDSERNDLTMDIKDMNQSKPNQEVRSNIDNNDLIITKDPIVDLASKQVETNVGPRKSPFLESEPSRNHSRITNIADRRKLMEKYTIKFKNPVEGNILNASNIAKNPALAGVTVVKTPVDYLKDDFRNKNSVQTNVIVLHDGQAKNQDDVAKTKPRCSTKKVNLDGNVKTMVEKITVEESELDSSYQTAEADNEMTMRKNSVKQSVPSVIGKSPSSTKIKLKKFNSTSGKEVKMKSEKNERLLITLRPTLTNQFTTSSESEAIASDIDYGSHKIKAKQRPNETAEAKIKYNVEPKVSAPKNAKDVKQIHQNLLKKNALLLAQLQNTKQVDDEADVEKPEKAKRKKKKARKTIRPLSPPMPCGAISPTTTEVARWGPRSIDDHTKAYYEAWVNTTLAAITKQNTTGQKNNLYSKKKNIIQTFQTALEEYDNNDVDLDEDYTDEKFTGRIKFKVKR